MLAVTVKVAVWPSVTVWLAGCVVTATGCTTVSAALRLVTLLLLLETSTRSSRPLSPAATAGSTSVGVVPPATSAQLPPPLPLDCQRYTGALPVAATLNVAFAPAATDRSAGCVAMATGTTGVVTVSVATLLVTLLPGPSPATCTRSCSPLLASVAAKAKLAAVAPLMSVQAPPTNCCHW